MDDKKQLIDVYLLTQTGHVQPLRKRDPSFFFIDKTNQGFKNIDAVKHKIFVSAHVPPWRKRDLLFFI